MADLLDALGRWTPATAHTDRAGLWVAIALAASFSAIALSALPILPLDETRYVSVAWEMWSRGDFLVPHLNGAEYSHKPPLLFWLFHVGWWLFGVNDWWPRIVPTVFACGALALAWSMARALWPSRLAVALTAPIFLQASALWAALTPAVLFDMVLAVFCLLALTGVLRAWRKERWGWSLYGIGLGLAILTKGPVALVHVLPAALLAPLWMQERRPAWRSWYVGMTGGIAIAAAIALSWAVPAAFAGSMQYRHAILWGQSAERVVHSFAHAHAFWWYAPLVPIVLAPWSAWPTVWKGLASLARERADSGTRFCIVMLVCSFSALSFISGKQVHYLLPLLAPCALLLARSTAQGRGEPALQRPRTVATIAVASYAAFALIGVVVARTLGSAGYDLREVATYLKGLEREGTPLAHHGHYHGQYQFLGRLQRPLFEGNGDELRGWLDHNPRGRVIVYFRSAVPDSVRAEYSARYRRRYVAVFSREGFLALDRALVE